MNDVQVDIWVWRLDASVHDCNDAFDRLAADEKDRARRFRFDKDRSRYITARSKMRQILSGYTDSPAEDLTFTYGEFEKPALPDMAPHFNLSHSENFAALAVCWDCEIGIDIEKIRPIERDVAEQFFSKAENAALAGRTGVEWEAGFFRCWTCKEAIVKALGSGLSVDLASFDVCLTPEQPGRVERFEGAGIGATDWALHIFQPAEDFAGALAARTGGRALAVTRRQ